MILTIDSFGWIEAIRGSPLGRRVLEAIDAAKNCFTASISIAEVAAFCLREGLSEGTTMNHLERIGEASRIVATDPSLAVAGARALDELRKLARDRHVSAPGLADGLILATARRQGSRVLTGDRHFQGLPDTVWLD